MSISIRQLAIEIYGGCNYKCEMCPQATGRHSGFLRKLPFDIFQKVLDDVAQYGCETVSLHGSGEATLHPEMPRFVEAVKKAGMQCITVTNGFLLNERLSRRLIDAGIDVVRVSGIGYDDPSYQKWMKKDAFDLVRHNTRTFAELNDKLGRHSALRLYHLILDPAQEDTEIEAYKRNWIEYCGVQGEIWRMHNWSGLYQDLPWTRQRPVRRSCGRPRSPYLNVRAGGLNNRYAAVVPCCFVLGRDEEAVLGYLDKDDIATVLTGEAYETLRHKHDIGDFDSISYCKGCDQLFDAPESLVWTNIPGKAYGQSKVMQDLDYRQWTA